MIYKKLQIGVGFCNLFTGYLPMITNNIYGSGMLKVAGEQKIFTLEGWNGILGVRMDKIWAGIDGPVLGVGETAKTRLFGVEIFSEEIFLSRNFK